MLISVYRIKHLDISLKPLSSICAYFEYHYATILLKYSAFLGELIAAKYQHCLVFIKLSIKTFIKTFIKAHIAIHFPVVVS